MLFNSSQKAYNHHMYLKVQVSVNYITRHIWFCINHRRHSRSSRTSNYWVGGSHFTNRCTRHSIWVCTRQKDVVFQSTWCSHVSPAKTKKTAIFWIFEKLSLCLCPMEKRGSESDSTFTTLRLKNSQGVWRRLSKVVRKKRNSLLKLMNDCSV